MDREAIAELIDRRMRQIMIHSHIYYLYNNNVISDYQYDKYSKELAELLKKHRDIAKEHELYEKFKDFDGSTGYHLVDMDGVWATRALVVLTVYENDQREGN